MESGHCRRMRKITPQRLALSLIQSPGEGKVETLADLQREFNRMHGLNVRYKPFHKQLSKESFPEFMRSLCAWLMSKLSGQVLNFSPDSPFSRFSHIILHDGSSFAPRCTPWKGHAIPCGLRLTLAGLGSSAS